MTSPQSARPVALVTGASRQIGIAAAIAVRLAGDGWDVATTCWTPYDERMPWHYQAGDVEQISTKIRDAGARTVAVSEDLTDVAAPGRILDAVNAELGSVTALVMCHAESVDSGLLDTTVESFDRHFAVNARATWLLIREFANRFDDVAPVEPAPDGVGPDGAGSGEVGSGEVGPGEVGPGEVGPGGVGPGGVGPGGVGPGGVGPGRGRIVAITSDHTNFNLPYGASKGALDRIVLAAARELAHLRLTANVINPGPVDTGWMSDEIKRIGVAEQPFGRLGRPTDTAALVSFLCSADAGWINGQLLKSDGGLHA